MNAETSAGQGPFIYSYSPIQWQKIARKVTLNQNWVQECIACQHPSTSLGSLGHLSSSMQGCKNCKNSLAGIIIFKVVQIENLKTPQNPENFEVLSLIGWCINFYHLQCLVGLIFQQHVPIHHQGQYPPVRPHPLGMKHESVWSFTEKDYLVQENTVQNKNIIPYSCRTDYFCSCNNIPIYPASKITL